MPAAGADARAAPVAQEGAAAAGLDTDTPRARLLAVAMAAANNFDLPPMPEAAPRPAAMRTRERGEVHAHRHTQVQGFALDLGLILALTFRVLGDCGAAPAVAVYLAGGFACAQMLAQPAAPSQLNCLSSLLSRGERRWLWSSRPGKLSLTDLGC